MKHTLNILVCGASVDAQILAGTMLRLGHRVTICAQGSRAAWLRDCGLTLINAATEARAEYPVPVTEQLSRNTFYDFIFVVADRARLYQMLPVLRRSPSANIVLCAQTAMGLHDIAAALGEERAMFCTLSAGGYATDEGVVYQTGSNLGRMFRTTAVGEFCGTRTARAARLMAELDAAGFVPTFTPHVDRWLKTHAVIATAAAGALFACNGDGRELSGNSALLRELVLAVREGFAVLRQNGVAVEPEFLPWNRLPVGVAVTMCGLYCASASAETAFARHDVAAAAELQGLWEEWRAAVAQSRLPCPHTAFLARQFREYMAQTFRASA